MSASPNDVRPVLDAVARQAALLCHAPFARVAIVESDVLRPLAHYSVDGESPIPMRAVPLRRTSITSRAILDRTTIHHADIVPLLDTEYPETRENAKANGIRAILAVPLIGEGGGYGGIFVWRREPGLFAPDQVALVETFATQAAIAIENVRLFHEAQARTRELAESLRQQTATNEVLKVISRSTFDLPTVLHTLVESAARLCEADKGTITRQRDGRFYRAESCGFSREFMEYVKDLPIVPERGTGTGRALLEGRVIHIPDVQADPDYTFTEAQRLGDFRSMLAVPILRNGVPIGALALTRSDVRPFTGKQIELVTTFADQAAIAIENVRLFTELENRNRDLTEALEQQTATSEVLRVISRSPTDVAPVFATIAESALKLCHASSAAVVTFDGELIHVAALASTTAAGAEEIRALFPRPPSRDNGTTRAILTRAIVAIPDVLEDPEFTTTRHSIASGFRSVLAVPLMRDGSPIGAISLGRPEPGPFPDQLIALLKTFADQAVIAIENGRLFTELEARNSELTTALDQRTATAEILRVISSSPTDTQPVFDAIVHSAVQLCGAQHCLIFEFDGELLKPVAGYAILPEFNEYWMQHPMRPGQGSIAGLVTLDRKTLHVHDVLEQPGYEHLEAQKLQSYRTVLGVPMLRGETVIGVIMTWRGRVEPFTDKQVELVETFADQAVIAVENVRLFNELEVRNRDLTEALEQQTATSDILRVISRSPTDVQPVFDTIAKAAHELCRAESANVFTYDGELVELVSAVNVDTAYVEMLRQFFPRPPSRDAAVLRAILTRSLVAIPDVLEDPEYVFRPHANKGGFRSVLAVPLLREGKAIGGIVVGRAESGHFPKRQIALLQTFADQAVIAIENVRLFNELAARNHDLTEALEQQTATSEILRVISQSQTDVQPVFDTIAKAAHELCRAASANVFTFDGELVHLAAVVNVSSAYIEAIHQQYPRPLGREMAVTRAILTQGVIVIPDVLEDREYAIGAHSAAGGFRSVLAVPLMREGNAIGGIVVGRAEPGPFPDTQIALLQTFADQAVIAIENVRLFKELEARTTDLTRYVGELKALGDVGQAVSSTLDLETVLSTIVSRATQLAGMDGGSIYEYDEARAEFHLHTADQLPDEIVTALRTRPIRKGEGALGRMAMTFEPVQIRDITVDRSYQSRVRDTLLRLGYRSLLAVPLMRDNHLLGGLVVNRKRPGDFDAHVIDLLKTFATQSALAIQNARLFREIEVKSRQLETASRHKSEFLANMSHELRTPLNAIIGFSEVLSEKLFGEMNAKQTEYVGDISESGRHLLNLINDILDLSKIEAGRMELDASDFLLPTAIDNTLSLVRERAQRRSIRLTHAYDARVTTIQADERKVKQVLLNLLSNALKFTPEGGAVDVRTTGYDDRVEVAVTDTGVGIAPEDREAVFEEFRQVGLVARKIEGTGLGLAISRKFVELHGGRIWVTSQVGVGSTFTFTLPLR